MGEPVFEFVVGYLLGLGILFAGPIRRDPPDVPAAGTLGVEVDPFAVGSVFGAVIVRALRGEPLLFAAGYGNAKKVEDAVALADEGQPFGVGRPAVEVAGRGGRH